MCSVLIMFLSMVESGKKINVKIVQNAKGHIKLYVSMMEFSQKLNRFRRLCWCFTALRHILGHFGRGQLT